MALATMGTAVLGKFTNCFVDYLVFPIGRQFGNLFCYKNDIKNLTEHFKDLENVEAGVKRRADAAERNLEIVGDDVQNWLKKADVIKNEANKVLDHTADVEMGCLNGWCPNLLVRYSLSTNAKKMSEKLVELQKKGNEYILFAYPAPPMQKIVITEDWKDFESRKGTTKEVMDALENDAIRTIGICGMPGVGKTTIVPEVVKRVEVNKLFDEVVMAVVSNNQDFMKIQSELADMLDLKFEINETSLPLRAKKLRTRLSNGKKILVILDDIWEELKLEELGIPFGVGQHCCKVLLTSRNEHVCIEMRCQKNFAIGLLSKDKAWNLFKEMAGIEDNNTKLQPVAKDIADECRGLPLAIVTLAKALKNKEKNSWNVTLRKLRRNTEVPKRVETAIKLSYDMLETDESKSLLRLCSLFPESYDIPIECLVRYVVGLRLLKNVKTVSEARETVYSLIDQLKSCHLILVGDEEESVKLHDVVRDVCISIASKGKDAYLVRCDAGLKKWPQEDTFRHYSAISLKFDEFNEFPTSLDCPNLKLIQLQGSHDIRIVGRNELCTKFDSGDFFEGMKELRVVSLRSMFLQLPPPPLKFLMNLRTLCLDFCKLNTTDVAMIGSLKSLEILSFLQSYLHALPSEIGQLGNLKLLDLRCEPFVPGKLPPGVLSNLNRLEELYMGNNFSKGAEHVELNSLPDLNTLQICLSHEDMPKLKDFRFENLRRFQIFIGHRILTQERYHFQNELVLDYLDMGMLFGIGFGALLERSEIIQFRGMKGLGRNLFDELDEKESVNWKELRVDCYDELEYLIHRALPGKRFEQLEKLTLWMLPAMKSLFTGSVVKGFVQLQRLEIDDCKQMEYIVAKEEGEGKQSTERIEFPKLQYLKLRGLPMLRSFYPNSDNVAIESLFHRQVLLPSLETLDLENINNMVHIVDCHMQVGSFDQLQRKYVIDCGNLLNFAVAAQLELFRSFRDIRIFGGDALEAVFDLEGLKIEGEHAEVILVQLESLEIMHSSNLMHIWKMVPRGLQGFHNLKTLEISECGSLRYLLSPIMVNLLVNLQELHLEKCKMMEYIVAKEEGEGKKSTERIEFPKLKKLELSGLPMLRSFYPNSDNVAIESLFHRQVLLPSLERLGLEGINSKVYIVDCHMQVGYFDQLRSINVSLFGLLNFAVTAQLELFRSLQNIRIEGGDALQAVFDLEGLKVKGEHAEVILGQLESLEIYNLSKLMHIWKMVPKGLQGFHNLKTLTISNCGSLRYLLSPIMANLLVNLQDLCLENCKMMEEIIKTGQGHPEIGIVDDIVTKQEGEEIVFPRLSRLVLWDLENLTVFYSGKCGLLFPSLDQMYFEGCPKLKTFCSGLLHAPKLERVNTMDNLKRVIYNSFPLHFKLNTIDFSWVWMGDLNQTVQHI